MLAKEEIDSWNSLFPESKILQADLSKPTEPFLTKTLVSYLRSFGYKVEPPFSLDANDASDSSREKLLFLIKLTRHIDHILKITDKTYSFSYYDLIEPTPKRTSHMLGILLNYLYYYGMYKTNIAEMANGGIKKHAELKLRIKKAQEKIDQHKFRAERVKSEIARLTIQVSAKKAKENSLDKKKAKQTARLETKRKALQSLTTKLNELKVETDNLKKQLVPNEEARDLEAEVVQLKEDVEKREILKKTKENSLREHQENIRDLKTLLKNIKELSGIVPLNLLQTYEGIREKLENSNTKLLSLESHREERLQKIEKQKSAYSLLQENLKEKTTKFAQEKMEKLQLNTENQKLCDDGEAKLAALKNEQQALECLREEQMEIRKFLVEHITELLAAYE